MKSLEELNLEFMEEAKQMEPAAPSESESPPEPEAIPESEASLEPDAISASDAISVSDATTVSDATIASDTISVSDATSVSDAHLESVMPLDTAEFPPIVEATVAVEEAVAAVVIEVEEWAEETVELIDETFELVEETVELIEETVEWVEEAEIREPEEMLESREMPWETRVLWESEGFDTPEIIEVAEGYESEEVETSEDADGYAGIYETTQISEATEATDIDEPIDLPEEEEAQEAAGLIWAIEYPEAEETIYAERSVTTEVYGYEEPANYKEEPSVKQPVIKPMRKAERNRRRVLSIVSDILFYAAILLVLFSVITAEPSDGQPKVILGYSYFTVQSASMEDKIPEGSFILVRKTGPQELMIGDNITFMQVQGQSVTQQIVNIYENYGNTGVRGFQTQSLANGNPNNDIVHEEKVIGKVIAAIPKLGAAILYLNDNIVMVFTVYGIFIVLSFGLRWLMEKSGKKKPSARARQNKATVP